MKKYNVKPEIGYASTDIYFGDAKNSKKDIIYLGKLGELGATRKVFFDGSGERVVAIVGKRGSGKSYTLGSILDSLCTPKGYNELSTTNIPRGIMLFDSLNIFWTSKYPLRDESNASPKMKEQFKLLRGWGLNPTELNVEVWVPGGYKKETMQPFIKEFFLNTPDMDASDWATLLNIDLIQDKMGQLLNETFGKVVNDGYYRNGKFISPKKEYTIDDLINCINHDDEFKDVYVSSTKRAVAQQLHAYNHIGIFKLEGTKLSELIKPSTLTVLMVNDLPDDLRLVIVSVLIKKILNERAGASYLSKRLKIEPNINYEERKKIEIRLNTLIPRTWIAIDEAQNFLPSERKTTATDILVRLVREGRNIGLSFVVTTQQPSALDNRIMAQVDTLIIHKLAIEKDVAIIYSNLKSNEPDDIKYGHEKLTFSKLIRSLELGQAIISNTETTNNITRSFVINVRPRIVAHGGFED